MSSNDGAIVTAENVLSTFHKAAPWVETVLPMVPAVGVQAAIVVKAADSLEPLVQQALEAIAASNGGNILDALVTFVEHITPGAPNAAALSPAPVES